MGNNCAKSPKYKAIKQEHKNDANRDIARKYRARQDRIDNLLECISKTHTCVGELQSFPSIPLWCGQKKCVGSDPSMPSYEINVD